MYQRQMSHTQSGDEIIRPSGDEINNNNNNDTKKNLEKTTNRAVETMGN
jgi:hypothetical protein